MIRVKLFTADGGFVVEGEIPPFQTASDVLLWGERVFKLADADLGLLDCYDKAVAYVECFAVALVRTV